MKSHILAILSVFSALTGCRANTLPKADPPYPTSASALASSSAPLPSPVPTQVPAPPVLTLLHVDIPYQLMKGKRFDHQDDLHMSAPRLKAGHVGAFVSAQFIPRPHWKAPDAYCSEAWITTQRALSDAGIAEARTLEELRLHQSQGKTSVVHSVEGSTCFRGRVEAVSEAYRRGVRMMGLTWDGDHDFATSSTYHGNQGLTDAGREAIRKMNELGVIIDVSHMSDAAIDEVLRLSTAPVLASHSNARAVCDHQRNLTDAHIQAIAAKGGLVGLTFYGPHLSTNPTASLKDVMKHLDYLRGLVGINAIGIGSDFDGIERGPTELENAAALPNLVEAMRGHGYSQDDIDRVLGENFLRVWKTVEELARK